MFSPIFHLRRAISRVLPVLCLAASVAMADTPLVLKSLGSEATWVTSSWGACSQSCGTGTQTRTAACQLPDGTVVDNSLCVQAAPTLSQSCAVYTGCAYNWSPGTWDTCSATCGYGTQSRNVWCVRSNGDSVIDSLCSSASRPDTTQTCSAYLSCAYTWRVEAGWGACSASCGTGTQTRPVGCYREDNTKVADSACDPATKPITTQACTTPCAPCSLNGTYVAHGGSIVAFANSVVNYSSNCTTQVRSCTNGALSGSYGYANCAVRFYSSGTVAVPAGVSRVRITLIGGGGGGSGAGGDGGDNGYGGYAGSSAQGTWAVSGGTVGVHVGYGGAGGGGYESGSNSMHGGAYGQPGGASWGYINGGAVLGAAGGATMTKNAPGDGGWSPPAEQSAFYYWYGANTAGYAAPCYTPGGPGAYGGGGGGGSGPHQCGYKWTWIEDWGFEPQFYGPGGPGGTGFGEVLMW